jgi:hypothetical protein
VKVEHMPSASPPGVQSLMFVSGDEGTPLLQTPSGRAIYRALLSAGAAGLLGFSSGTVRTIALLVGGGTYLLNR